LPRRLGEAALSRKVCVPPAGRPWIVDQRRGTVTVLRHDGVDGYGEVAGVGPGQVGRVEEPFPVPLDGSALE
jgi:hypothetical protein